MAKFLLTLVVCLSCVLLPGCDDDPDLARALAGLGDRARTHLGMRSLDGGIDDYVNIRTRRAASFGKRAVPGLAALLKSGSELQKRDALVAAGSIGTDALALEPLLLVCAQAEETEERAVLALARVAPESAKYRALLLSAFNEPRPKRHILMAVGFVLTPLSLGLQQRLVELAASRSKPEETSREAWSRDSDAAQAATQRNNAAAVAAWALGRQGRAAAHAVPFLTQTAAVGGRQYLRALARIGSEPAVAALLEFSKSEDESIAYAGLAALTQVRPVPAFAWQRLRAGLAGNNPLRVLRLIPALGLLATRLTPDLLPLLKPSRSELVRRLTLDALSQRDSLSEPVRAAVEALRNDPSKTISRRATKLLRAMEKPPEAVSLAKQSVVGAHTNEVQRAAAKKQGVRVAFENQLGMRFVLIPAGRYLMGAPPYWEKNFSDCVARPRTAPIYFKEPFYLQTTEVTNAQYRALVPDHRVEQEPGVDSNGPENPVTGITQQEAVAFLEALSKADPRKRFYRLPTEWEWECACAGGEETFWFWGSKPELGCDYARLSEKGVLPLGPTAVATLKPNPFGLFDMLGNVAEWTLNRVGPPAASFASDPWGPPRADPALEVLFRRRSVRGGHAGMLPFDTRRWLRQPRLPWRSSARTGFRAVVRLKPDPEPAAKATTLHMQLLAAESGKPLKASVTYEPKEGDPVPLESGTLPLPAGSSGMFEFRVAPPRGRRTWEGGGEPKGFRTSITPAPGAKQLDLFVPLYRSLRAKGQLKLPKGYKLPHYRVWADELGGMRLWSEWADVPKIARAPKSKGKFRIDDLPWIPGAPLKVVAVKRDGKVVSERGFAVAALPAVFKKSWQLPQSLTLRPAESSGGGVTVGRGMGGGSAQIKYEDIQGKGAGSIRISFIGRDKEELGGVIAFRNLELDDQGLVRGVGDIAIVSSIGMVVFPVVPPGKHTITIYDRGRLIWRKRVQVSAENEAWFNAKPVEYASVSLQIVRPEGGPAAWAHVSVQSASGLPWHDVDPAGRQRVGPTLDHAGRATLHGFLEGTHRLRVTWHGRFLTHDVTLEAGQQLKLDLTLGQAKGWGPGAASK